MRAAVIPAESPAYLVSCEDVEFLAWLGGTLGWFCRRSGVGAEGALPTGSHRTRAGRGLPGNRLSALGLVAPVP